MVKFVILTRIFTVHVTVIFLQYSTAQKWVRAHFDLLFVKSSFTNIFSCLRGYVWIDSHKIANICLSIDRWLSDCCQIVTAYKLVIHLGLIKSIKTITEDWSTREASERLLKLLEKGKKKTSSYGDTCKYRFFIVSWYIGDSNNSRLH